MKQNPRTNLFPLAAFCVLYLLLPHLQAQTTTPIRPSSAANGTANRPNPAPISNSSGSNTRQYHDATMLGDAVIQIDPETRALVIVADEDTHTEIMKVIKNLDRPKPQVLIKVVFAQVTLNKSLNVGVEGSYTFNVRNGIATGGSTTTTNSTANTTGGTALTSATSSVASALLSPGTPGTASAQTLFGLAQLANGSFVRLATDNWQATLYALAAHGNVNVLSRPTIMARNNQQAVIVVGQEVPFVTNSQVTQLGQTINTVQYQDVGVILRVTPFITSDNNVEMIVSPEVSSVDSQSVQLSPNVSSPIIDKIAAETVVVTPNAETVVIGGMMQKQKTSTVQKIPLLGDLPVIGAAFRHTTKSDTRTELLIFLTPYIIQGTEKMKELTADEVDRTELPQKAFSQEDLHKYLDDLKIKQRAPGPPPSPLDPEVLTNKLYKQSDKGDPSGGAE